MILDLEVVGRYESTSWRGIHARPSDGAAVSIQDQASRLPFAYIAIAIPEPAELPKPGTRVSFRLVTNGDDVPAAEALAILERVPGAVRVCEGGGPENLAASLAVTVAALVQGIGIALHHLDVVLGDGHWREVIGRTGSQSDRFAAAETALAEARKRWAPQKCPTCFSPARHLHPAVQHEGEVQVCGDAWHTPQPGDAPAV